MKRCILNVAFGPAYEKLQDRLIASLDTVGETADRLFWRGRLPPGSPLHNLTPFGFKIAAFDEAKAGGYQQALWVDAQVRAVKPLDLVWAALAEKEVLLLGDGWNVAQWTSDAALQIYGISRDEAGTMQMCYAKSLGLDLTSAIAIEFLTRWRRLRDLGAFAGSWTNANAVCSTDPRCKGHRHDQSAASFLAWQMELEMVDINPFLSLSPDQGDPVFRA